MVCRSSFRRLAFVLSVCSVLTLGAAAAADERARPSISVEDGDGASQLWVDVVLPDGTAHRRLLRETSAAVRPIAGGWGPSGRTGFTTWEESGARWFSYSRDAGESWNEARPLRLGLRLRDGDVGPEDRMPDAPHELSLPPDGKLFVVQFKTISLPEWRSALEGAGAEVLAYLPDNAHVVRLGEAPAARVEALARLDMVERVEPYHPWYRLSAELRSWLEEPGGIAPERKRVRVAAFDWGPAGKGRIAELAEILGAEVVEIPHGGHVVELNVDREQLARLAAHDDVEWIDPWGPPSVDMDLVREDSGAEWLEASLDNLGYCGQGVRGEVSDNGIWETHPDFDPILMHGPSQTESHGTNSYGVVFGRGYEDPRARGLLPCGEGIFARFGSSYDHVAELKQSPYFASFQTRSFGTPNTLEYTSYSAELDDIIWRLDIAITQSQDNTGNRLSNPRAWAKNVISVGGIRHRDTLDTSDDFWSGTSIGPAEDGRIKPDLSYWADYIYTTDIEPGHVPGSLYRPDFGYTSAATPQVAGVLGLMLQMWKENVWGTNHPPELTVFEAQPHFSTLKALLVNNTQQYTFVGEEHNRSRYKQGWGRPSVQVAAERAASSFIVDQEVLLEVDEMETYRIDVAPGETDLKVTMVYPDPPGTPGATMARVNDLDLRVISPSGVVYHGNVGLTTGTTSVTGGAANRIDTVENVFVADPEPGTWSVAVNAVEINEDACPVDHESICGPATGGTLEDDATFSLVVTGGTGGASCTAPNADVTAAPNQARIGDVVQFQSTVSGGAGDPYSYWWDFNGDGAVDSTEANPEYAYARPFDGPAKLWVADTANCPVTVHETMTVHGPDLWYDGFIDLTEVEGNGNGGVDPGETWDLAVRLRNDGSEAALGVSADLVPDPASPVSVTLLRASSPFADIPVGEAVPSNLTYRFRVDSYAPCGESISLNVTVTSTDPANTYPTEVGVIRIPLGRSVILWEDGFEEDKGWESRGNGEWERGMPQGLGEPGADPQSAYEGQFVLGTDLTGLGDETPGNYENDVNSRFVSPVIDIPRGYWATHFTFVRWLHLAADDDRARLLFFPLGSMTWDATHNESSWFFHRSVDLQKRNWFRFEFELVTDAEGTNSGLTIDDFELHGYGCEPYPPVRYDSFSGLTEVDGNGNAAVEPGETWEITAHLRHDGPDPVGGVSADLAVDPATPGSVFLLQGSSHYGTIDPGEAVPSISAYRFRVGDDFPCVGEVVLSVTGITSIDPAGSYPDEVAVIRIPIGESATLFSDGFENGNDKGWRVANYEGDGEWQFDMPRGLGGPQADPQSAYEGQFVLGNDLTGLGLTPGNYENDVTSVILSPIIPVSSGYAATDITFAHWLNLADADLAMLQVDVAEDNTSLTWPADHSTESWSVEMLDIRELAAGKDWLQVQILLAADAQSTNSGWNIDAFEVHGRACEAFERPLPGEATNLTIDVGAAGELVLSWGTDCGNATTYGIYRGELRVGYDSIVPEPGACDVTGTTATIPLGSGDAEFFLVVPHKDGEEGSYGTDSSGTPRSPAVGGCYPRGAVDVCAH